MNVKLFLVVKIKTASKLKHCVLIIVKIMNTCFLSLSCVQMAGLYFTSTFSITSVLFIAGLFFTHDVICKTTMSTAVI